MKPAFAWLGRTAGFATFVLRRWSEDRCPQVAGSLTFTTVLAMVPLVTVVITLLSGTPFFEGAMVQFKVFLLLNLVPEIAGRIITVFLAQFAESAERLTTVSLAALFAMSIALLATVDHALNTIWRVKRRRPLWISVVGYCALLAVGPLLMGLSLWATTWLVTASLGQVDLPSQLQAVVLRSIPTLVSASAFVLVYRFFPNHRVPVAHALAGGFLAAVVFEVMKSLFAVWLQAVPTYRLVYGAFAAIPIFLLWLYLSWLVVLLGAEFTAALGHWRPAGAEPVSEAGWQAAQTIESALAPPDADRRR